LSDRDDIIAHHAAGTLPELLVERLRGHRTDELGKAFRATLTSLHNNGTIDVLGAARQIASSPIDQHQFFTVMHIYSELIPALEAEMPAMLAAVKALVARAGNDGAAGMPNGAYRTWAEQGDRARATLAAIDPEDPDDSAYVFIGLQALAKAEPDAALDKAIAYLGGTSVPARSAAAKAIGTFGLATPEARRQAAEALSAAAPTADDNSLGHILTAMCEIARAYPDMAADAAALIGASDPQAGDQAIHQLSLELMFHGEELPANIVAGLTAIIHRVPIANRGTLEHIDAAGGKLVTQKRLDEALALITPLISTHDELASLETLDSFSYALLQLPADQLAQVCVGWLLSLDTNLGRATMSLVSNHHSDKPLILQLERATLDLPDADRILLAHRAIGWLFIHPVTAASLVVGLLEGAAEATTKVIADLLFDPLLINFSGSVGDWIAGRAKDGSDPVQPLLAELVARLEAYIEGLRQAGRINELRPSERERLIENHRQNASMRQVYRQAEKKSIIASLATRQVLLYGTQSISYFKGPGGEKQRSEMKMHSFSHSIESPRLDTLEPFDLDYMLRVFRTMRNAAP
jgi:hypothetical protein